MKINTSVLKQYIDLPADPRAIRMLLDDIGIASASPEAMLGTFHFR